MCIASWIVLHCGRDKVYVNLHQRTMKFFLRKLYLKHVILNTRPSHFSVCNIEKLRVAWILEEGE